MVQKLGDHIRACYDRATDCVEQGKVQKDKAIKADLLKIEKTWVHLAKCYEYVQSLQTFLLDAERRRREEINASRLPRRNSAREANLASGPARSADDNPSATAGRVILVVPFP